MDSTQGAPMPTINLLRGWPAPSLLPTKIIQDAAQAALSSPSVAFAGLEYGPDPGYEPCREAIAKWLTTSYRNLPAKDNYAGSDAIESEHICITGGASQNLANMLAVYTDPTYTRNVWIVAPAYMLAFRVFEDAGFGTKMRAVPDDQGIDLDYLRRELIESEAQAVEKGMDKPLLKPGRKVYKHVIYCVPSFSNPTGVTLSLSMRAGLVRLARDFDALVIPDDVYDFLHWPVHLNGASSEAPEYESTAESPTVRLPRLVDIDQSLDGGAERCTADGFGNVCSNGSFSKIVGPGVRVGWVQGSRKFIHGVAST
jgi:DNA-binding transcriptional MocR family regulator